MRINRSTIFRALAAVAAVLLFAVLYAQWIAPLKTREQASRQTLFDLKRSLEPARKTMQRAMEVEQEMGHARRKLNGIHGDDPQGSALIWLPEMVKEHFKQIGIAVSVVRLNAVREEPGLPGYRRAYWGVGLPVGNDGKSVRAVLAAVAEIEEQNRSIQVLDFTIQPDVEDPQRRTAAFNIEGLVRK